MIDLDLIRDLCGSLPPFPDGCEVTRTETRGYAGQVHSVRVYATAPNGARLCAIHERCRPWRVSPLPTPCRQAVETCLAGSHPASGNGFVAGSVAGSNAPQAGCDRV